MLLKNKMSFQSRKISIETLIQENLIETSKKTDFCDISQDDGIEL